MKQPSSESRNENARGRAALAALVQIENVGAQVVGRCDLAHARAEIEQIEAGLKSRTQALAERGYDAEQVDGEIAANREREQRLGLSFGSTPSPPPGGNAPIQTDQ